MKIAIDLRSLSSGSISGVENYIVGLLDHLLPMDRHNSYILFYNAWGNSASGDFHFVNSTVKTTKTPNKLLNAQLKLGLVKMESLTGPIDCLFLPNLNQFSIGPQTKLAITVHDLSPVVTPEFYDLKRRLWHKFLQYKKSFDRANIIFAVSEYTKHDLIRLFQIPAEKIRVVYPGVDPQIFSPDQNTAQLIELRNKYSLPGNFLLFLSTIEPRKNLGNLIKAFELLETNAYLVIVGKAGWKYRTIFEQIRNSKKSAKIKYMGYVSEQEKAKIIKLAQAVVYPSFYEGFGFVPLEAASIGVPVLASSVTSLPEVVSSAALLVNPYNVMELKKGLQEILNNDLLRANLIANGKDRARQFSWQKTAEGVLEGLNSI